MWVILGYNYKRGRKEKSGDYRNTKLYQQRFPFRRKVTCNEEFIAQAGLNDESIQKAVISALDTDYGIKLEIRGEVVTSPPKVKVGEESIIGDDFGSVTNINTTDESEE